MGKDKYTGGTQTSRAKESSSGSLPKVTQDTRLTNWCDSCLARDKGPNSEAEVERTGTQSICLTFAGINSKDRVAMERVAHKTYKIYYNSSRTLPTAQMLVRCMIAVDDCSIKATIQYEPDLPDDTDESSVIWIEQKIDK